MALPQVMKDAVSCCLVAAIAASVGACASAPPAPPESEAVAPPPPLPPEPALTAAHDAQLTLFGEFPERARVPFEARASSPMKQHSFTTEGADFDVDVSPDGQWLVFGSTRHSAQPDLYLKTIDGQAVTQLTSDPAADVQPCFSPDGKRVIFASYRSGNWDLWMVGLDGGQATQITHSPLHEVHPSFAPDGLRVVYCMFNDRAGQWELWTLQLDRPGSRKMIGVGLFPKWSPTTDSIVYQRARERGGRWFSIWRTDLELGEPKFPIEIASSPDMALIQPGWSLDGKWITYGTARLQETTASDETAQGQLAVNTRGDIWIVRADGSSPLQLTDGAGAHFGPAWSKDGRVYFTTTQSGSENVWSVKPFYAELTQMPEAPNDTAAARAPGPSVGMPSEAGQGG